MLTENHVADRLTTTRNAAILLRYAIEKWAEKHPGDGQSSLGKAIRETDAFKQYPPRSPNREDKRFDPGHMSKLANGTQFISKTDEKIVRGATSEILEKLEIEPIDLDHIPFSLLYKYGKALESQFGDYSYYIPRSVPVLSSMARIFTGLWRFFIVLPDSGPPREIGARTIRSNVIYFHKTSEQDRRAHGMMIGPQSSRWSGSCWRVGETHVALLFREPDGGRMSFTLAPNPTQTDDGFYKIAGLGNFLLPSEAPGDRIPPTIMSALVCGTSCELENCGVGDNLEMGSDIRNVESLRSLVNTTLDGNNLTQTQATTLSEIFRRREMSIKFFCKKFLAMKQYLDLIKIQGILDIKLSTNALSYILDSDGLQSPGMNMR
jgi:hypothetical protein